jgi:hypothetical protein
VNGSITFDTYDDKPVNPCNDFAREYYTEEEQIAANCNMTTTASAFIDIGLIYNDVWAYKLCNPNIPLGATEPERGFDTACKETGWVLWHPGAPQGGKALSFLGIYDKFTAPLSCACYPFRQLCSGCTIQLGIEVCTVPSERYNHGSVMHDDGTLYVYGGFSQRCEDYCDDIWFFDIYLKVRTYSISALKTDYFCA